MHSQRDQVQAHRFVMDRVTSGILRVEPDALRTPTSRTLRGSIGGLILGVLLCIGAGVYGLVKPGGTTGWAKNGTLVVAKDTGAAYFYMNNALHPVLNETSAKLLAGTQMTVDDVTSSQLLGAPLGAPVGIVGAPAALPVASDLTAAPWLACASQQSAPDGASTAALTVEVGQDSAAPGSLPGTQLTADQALLVQTPDNTVYLLWRGERMRVATRQGVLAALGYTGDTPFPVPEGFINALPSGPDLAPPPVAGLGEPGPALSDRPTRYGQLFTGPAAAHYVLTESGLEPVTAMQYALLFGDPAIQAQAYGGQAVTAEPVGAQDLQNHLATATSAGLPEQPPTLVSADLSQPVCAETVVAASSPTYAVALLPADAVSGSAPVLGPGDQAACQGADLVAVPSGRGALVRGVTGGGAAVTEYLVTDDGIKYPLRSPSVAGTLGYSAVPPAAVPTSLLALLPTGPSLDPALISAGGIAQPQTSAAYPGCGRTSTARTTPAVSSTQ